MSDKLTKAPRLKCQTNLLKLTGKHVRQIYYSSQAKMSDNLTNAHRLKCQTISITDSLSKKNLILSKYYIMYTRTHYNT